jgi:DNA-binding response OmpR family regulator
MCKKILIVDDEPDIVKVVAFRLEKEGYEVHIATDGEKALEVLEQDKPGVVLLDITLPRLNGYEVCARMKANKALKDIPVIFVTASLSTEEFKQRFLETGAQGYVFKPFEFGVLSQKIKDIMNKEKDYGG